MQGPFTRGAARATATAALLLVSLAGSAAAQTDQPAINVEDGTQISEYQFTPANIQVNPGDTVTWTNTGRLVHTITAPDGSFESGALNPGDTYSITFDAPGTYAYTCYPHPWMKGTIVVGGGA